MQPEPFDLTGRVVRLAPIRIEDIEGLVAAANEDRSTYGYTTVPADRQSMAAHVDTLIGQRDRGRDVPFTTFEITTGRVIGSTRFLAMRSYFGRADPDAVEIGGTWLGASAQRTGANTDAKLLMLTHAFEAWNVQRVDFKTDARNARSRAAIERLGRGSTACSVTGNRPSSPARKVRPATARCTRSSRPNGPRFGRA